ncbi:isoleucine--tRNA ligase [Helicobacter kayseriensis]|uniref:isoleucine--tRNA ligase n=1 Tax=Helicobacter kayseriensis TaxID=2905877 RepID=UPI001E58C748|nr:isoleucine--tRNA ligase [Helicobacter kayseriensis]MCE3047212.1 isoleucine--tRNA ligase [Helicobacter kayseriensis]MCE3048583.1 isoleucine--tRNA ligase [Helicobacter kayseriensis]
MDYKDTMRLPQTDFPMRGNLCENEPKVYQAWKSQAFQTMREKRLEAKNQGKKFTLHDGPPYANGHIHTGHAVNKILKDIIVKFAYFQGKYPYYTPGWDCHGLPIEQQVEKKIGKAKKDILPKEKIRELCRDWAKEFIQIQSDEFQSLGVLGDFENPYRTLDFEFEADIYQALCEIAKNGLLAQRYKPIYWSWAAESALAEAEVEYEEKESDSVFVAFPLMQESLETLGIDHGALVIWTTTPWTLPANVAIALKPNEVYVMTQKGHIVAKELLESLRQKGVIAQDDEVIGQWDSDKLERLKARNPLNGRESLIILGEHVSTTDGTGCVHTATGHGEDDYYVGLKYDLPTLVPVDEKGRYNDLILSLKLLPSEFLGQNIFEAQDKVIKLLGSALLKHAKIRHSYPHCWRTHQPVIFRATTQWFILMDKPYCEGKTLREVALQEIEKVKFYPESGKNRLKTMIENRPDWCISRQRDWGVPIAFFVDKKTQEVILDEEVLRHLQEIFKSEGCDVWWSKEIVDLLPPSWKSRAEDLEKNQDILDVWFDSGSTWKAVLQSVRYDAGEYPADLYLEGSDQHRGWFQSSLLVSCAIHAKAPFKRVLTHGFCVDEKGEKMSKSKGNVIAPEQVLQEMGGEILRLWVASSDYQNDLKISKDILKQVSEVYRKIRNTIRFLLANTNECKTLVDSCDWSEIDLWIYHLGMKVFDEVQENFAEFEFVKGLALLQNFIVNELSGIYLELCKDILYCESDKSKKRQASMSVMAILAREMLFAVAPILTYTVNEALSYASEAVRDGGKIQNVFDLTRSEVKVAQTPQVDFSELKEIKDAFEGVLDVLKKEGKIKSSLEVEIATEYAFEQLAEWLIVSCVGKECYGEKVGEFEVSGKKFLVYRSAQCKCPRCWRYLTKQEGELCLRCQEVLEERHKI